jgi:hypothetical protein
MKSNPHPRPHPHYFRNDRFKGNTMAPNEFADPTLKNAWEFYRKDELVISISSGLTKASLERTT